MKNKYPPNALHCGEAYPDSLGDCSVGGGSTRLAVICMQEYAAMALFERRDLPAIHQIFQLFAFLWR